MSVTQLAGDCSPAPTNRGGAAAAVAPTALAKNLLAKLTATGTVAEMEKAKAAVVAENAKKEGSAAP